MPNRARFGFFSAILHHERCYTQDELLFRERVITIRQSSGISADLLQGASSWFDADASLALDNVNENSWLYAAEFQPRHSLSETDFHIGLVPTDRLNWVGLSTLTRTIGDYLLFRNSRLQPEYLNQPVNYVLLDLARMLRQLAMIERADYVAGQVQLLQQYVRAVEIHVPYTEGSDRLFLADCRYSMDQVVNTDIRQQIQSRQLRQHFQDVRKQLNQIGEMRHTLLHYAFSRDEVNPHPYWESFSDHELAGSQVLGFPVLMAKSCAQSTAVTTGGELPSLELRAEDLSHCPGVHFIEQLDQDAKDAYARSIADLQEILRFQHIIDQLIHVLEQAGEVFTLVTFREQMMDLLQTIDQFIQRSQAHIVRIQDVNTQIYHQYMQDRQNLGWWDTWIGNREKLIKQYVSNQDNLARFSLFPGDFQAANAALSTHVNQLMQHLHQQPSAELQLIDTTRQQIDSLMLSMHAWVGRQRALEGQPHPALSLISPVEEMPARVDADRSAPVFNAVVWTPVSLPLGGSTSLNCAPAGMLDSGYCEKDCALSEPSRQADNHLIGLAFLGVFVTVPLVLIVLKLLYDSCLGRPARPTGHQDSILFGSLKTAVEDRLALLINAVDEEDERRVIVDDCEENFARLLSQSEQEQYDIDAMQELADSLADLLADIDENARQCPRGQSLTT